jgi:tungstate transport system substrate-binding protein
LDVWAAAGVAPARADWYRIAQSGMAGSAATAREAAAQHAYTLIDRATFITAKPELDIMVEGDPRLLNVFSALPVNPRRAADVNEGGAEAFLNWLLGEHAQQLIGDFGKAEHGTALFLRRDQIPATSG